MRNPLILALIVTLTLPALAPVVGALHPAALPGEETATVTLEVDSTNFPAAALADFKSCDVTVPAHATVSSVLDKATLDGCIAGWTSVYYVSMGRFVTGIDGRQADCNTWVFWLAGGEPPLCTWWTYTVDGQSPDLGVDSEQVNDGSTYTFHYHVETSILA